MSLKRAYVGARIIESMENYSLADKNEVAPASIAEARENSHNYREIYDDQSFWSAILRKPEVFWNKKFGAHFGAVSNWVPRVPGLFWSKGANAIRDMARTHVALKHGSSTEYQPAGKSSLVSGGIGTFILPADPSFRMMTLSCNANASSGIPVLFSREVIEQHNISEGSNIKLEQVPWVQMPAGWVQHFPTTRGIPRGCLLVTNPKQVYVGKRRNSMEVHPFSIMQYEKKGALLYDFVFCTIPSTSNYRKGLSQFFEYYRTKENRNGKYLLAVDMTYPIFEARYNTPEDLRRLDPSGESQLSLITNRIRQGIVLGHLIDDVIAFITEKYYTAESVLALAIQVKVKPGSLTGGNAATLVNDLVEKLYEAKKIETLIDAVSIKYPQIAAL